MAAVCPECAEPVGAADRFCEACGTGLRVRRGGTAGSVGDRERSCPGCGRPAEPTDGGYCAHCGLRHRDAADRVEVDLGMLAGVSDRGHLHARNEDAMALGVAVDGTVAAVVCDGVSSSPAPERASRAAAEAALDVLLGGRPDPGQRTRDAVAAAASVVAAVGPPGGDGPACTLVSAVVDGDGTEAAEITIGWVGDSRAYWLPGPGAAEPARMLTADHSWAVEMVAAGLLDAEAAAADRRSHVITRWLGVDGPTEPDVVTLRPAGPGVLLLCTDGLWNDLPAAADLAAALPTGVTPFSAAGTLTRSALDAGGRDNITVVIIPVTTRSTP